MIVKIDSLALATAANNALAFLPANSQVKVARLQVTGEEVTITATDTYAAGRDSAPVDACLSPDAYAHVLIDRAALQGLDSAGRRDKKGIGTLSVKPGDGIIFTPQDSATIPPEAHLDLAANAPADTFSLFRAIDDMLEEDQPFRTAFQPQLLMRFSKVKADKSERVADMAIAHPDEPVLVKIGRTFTGLIMPVNRADHSEKIGEEGLW